MSATINRTILSKETGIAENEFEFIDQPSEIPEKNRQIKFRFAPLHHQSPHHLYFFKSRIRRYGYQVVLFVLMKVPRGHWDGLPAAGIPDARYGALGFDAMLKPYP